MGKVLVFVVGVFAGAGIALLGLRTSPGGRLLAAANGTTGEFLRAMSESYRARRAEAT